MASKAPERRRGGAARTRALLLLHVGGFGRSGTTLFERMLGQLPRAVALGEVRQLWRSSELDSRPCSCGAPAPLCPFWAAVIEGAVHGRRAIDEGKLEALDVGVVRSRMLPALLLPSLWPGYRRAVRRYLVRQRRVYEAAAREADARVLVDAGGGAAYPFLLRHVPRVRLHVVWLIRDGRASAFAWRKRVRRWPVPGAPLMTRLGITRSAVGWTLTNLAALVFRLLDARLTVVRYERLVADPRRELLRVMRRAGIDHVPSDLDFVDGDAVRLGGDHILAGNRMRFRTGTIPIRADDEWRTAMALSERRLFTFLTWPVLAALGYLRAPWARASRVGEIKGAWDPP